MSSAPSMTTQRWIPISSPQTGALLGVGGAAVLMAVSGGMAVVSGKKARDCR